MENKHWISAQALSKEGQHEKAYAAYNKAMLFVVDNPDLYHDRAVCLFHLGRSEDAMADLNYAVKLQPDYSYRYSSRAYIRSAMKDYDGALADYRKAVELDPEDAVAQNNLGLLEEQAGWKKQAQERFKIADELSEMLEEQNIDTESKQAAQQAKPKTSPAALQPEKNSEKSQENVGSVMASVFKSKKVFKEFVQFIRNGFTLKDK
jgi:tetratricopeptide (TPR) repeat protein